MIDGGLSREQMEILAQLALNALSFSFWIHDKSHTLQEQSSLLYEHAHTHKPIHQNLSSCFFLVFNV